MSPKSDERDVHPAYRPDIDGLRAVAVLSVMFFHLNHAWLPGGFAGVDVFFVISGFVVTASLGGSRANSMVMFIGEFYSRRLARIIPALVVVLIFSALVAIAFIPNAWLSHFNNITAQYAFFGLSNWIMQNNSDTYFAPRAEFNPYTHTWSLGVEEQFYVLAPLLVYAWVRALRRGRCNVSRFATGGLVALTITSMIGCIWASKAAPTAAFYSIGYRFWELALGAVLFMISHHEALGTKRYRFSSLVQQVTAWGGFFIMGIGLVYAKETSFPYPWAFLPVIGTLLIIGGSHVQPTDMVRRTLASPLFVWIGKRSYSIYLWHWPVFVTMRWTVGLDSLIFGAAAVILTFVFSILSYRWVERPLRHNSWIEKKPNRYRILGFASLTFSGFLLVTHLFDHQSRYSLTRAARESIDWYALPNRLPYTNVGNRQCTVAAEWTGIANGGVLRFSPTQCGIKLNSRKVHVFGDSHAGMLAGMLEQVSAETGMEVNIYSGPGCGFLALNAPMSSVLSGACLDFHHTVSRMIIEMSSSGDILLLSTLRMSRYGDQWASFGIDDMYAHMHGIEQTKLRHAALEDAKNWLRPFSAKGVEIIFVAPTPIFKAPTFRCVDWFNRMNPVCIGDNRQLRSELNRLRDPIINGMQALAGEVPNVYIWDPFPLLCPGETCFTEREGRPLFYDGDHLSAYSNLLLYPAFFQFIQDQ